MPVQTESAYTEIDPIITFTQVGETWRVAKGIDLSSFGAGVAISEADGSTLINKGNIRSQDGYTVLFQYDDFTLINKPTGRLDGIYGVLASSVGTRGRIENEGIITGTPIAIYAFGPSDLTINNSGYVFGSVYGAFIGATNIGSMAGPVIMNTGKIESVAIGLNIIGAGTNTATVINKKDGSIKGATFGEGAAIYTSDISLELKNKALIEGDLLAEGMFDDTVYNSGKTKGDVRLGDGNDFFKNKIKGEDGKVKGKLYGEDGNDTFVLGKKAETIVFDTGLDGAANVDRIRKFESGKDKLMLDLAIFPELVNAGDLPLSALRKAAAALDSDDRVIYDKPTGAVYYDPDGTGPEAQVKFAQLDPGARLKATDFEIFA